MKSQLQSAVTSVQHTLTVAPDQETPKLQLTVYVFNVQDVQFQLYHTLQSKSHVAWFSNQLVVGVHILPFHVCVYHVHVFAVAFAGITQPQLATCVSATHELPFHV